GKTNEWSVQTWLDTGTKQYADDKTAFRSLPSNLYGAEWIRGPKQWSGTESGKLPTFTVSADADVFIGLDARITQKPTWIAAYEDTKTRFENSQGTVFEVYRKRFSKGATVTLGRNGLTTTCTASPYTVMATSISTIEPAYDLKPTTTYAANAMRLVGSGIVKETRNDRSVATFKKAAGDAVEWTISTGVADTYALTVRYANPTAKPLLGKLELLLADGTLIKTEAVEFTPTRPGKWNALTTSTGTMINAGNYTVRLTATNAEGLSAYQLLVQ
ncbi:hypothetical protein, partial [Spirosoma sp.]|uniref:hypothetical protein n=1 Tax=Spirosoma sp. TaxID=1899569 RepID=UPI003B3A5A44